MCALCAYKIWKQVFSIFILKNLIKINYPRRFSHTPNPNPDTLYPHRTLDDANKLINLFYCVQVLSSMENIFLGYVFFEKNHVNLRFGWNSQIWPRNNQALQEWNNVVVVPEVRENESLMKSTKRLQ